MRIVFAGTPEFARVALAALQEAGHTIALVLSQPDRPGGRGMKLQASAVKQFALQHAMAVAQPRSLRLDGKFPEDAATAQADIAAANADVMVVAAYGLILPQWVLDMPKLGCLNIHASLLPRWRGAAPIHRAIEAGDTQTGITIMQMDAGLDTGDMLLTQVLPIQPQDTTALLHDKLAALGGQMVVQALRLAAKDALEPVKQPAVGVTYAHKIEKSESLIDWSHTADQIVRRVLAFDPFPGTHSSLNGEVIKIWSATASAAKPPPTAAIGEIIAQVPTGIAVVAINSVVVLTQLQRPGGRRLAATDFLRGTDIRPGMRFSGPAISTSTSTPALNPTPTSA